MRNLRRTALGGFVIAAAVVTLGGLSWACTPHAMMADIQPGEGPAGMTVALRGNHFEARQIEIRLDSSDGRLLAVATGPELDTALRIPTDLEPGWINVVALSRSTEDPTQLNGQAVKSFRVTEAYATGPTTDERAPAPGSTSPAVADSQAAPAPSSAPAPETTSTSPAAAAGPASSAPAGSAVVGAPAGSPTATGAVPAPGGVASAGSAATAGARAAAAPPLASALAGDTAAVAAPPASATPDRRVSRRSATGEAWSDFAGRPAGPGLATDPVGAGDARGAAPAGLVLLGVGLAALLATGTAALAHQRRPRKA